MKPKNHCIPTFQNTHHAFIYNRMNTHVATECICLEQISFCLLSCYREIICVSYLISTNSQLSGIKHCDVDLQTPQNIYCGCHVYLDIYPLWNLLEIIETVTYIFLDIYLLGLCLNVLLMMSFWSVEAICDSSS